MNSAVTYKGILHKKKTYVVSMALALVLFLALAGVGVEAGMEVAKEEHEEERVLSNVPFAEHFMTYAPEIGWDWELLAAVAYHESRYNPKVISPSGARGLMQLMPVTGHRFGLTDSTFFVPEDNIAAGVKYIARLQYHFRFVTDSVEQTKFVLASYNAGPAHIFDARRLARKYGDNPNRWDNIERYLEALSQEEYYTDSVVQYGSFNSRETTRYVHNVLRTYDKIQAEEQTHATVQ